MLRKTLRLAASMEQEAFDGVFPSVVNPRMPRPMESTGSGKRKKPYRPLDVSTALFSVSLVRVRFAGRRAIRKSIAFCEHFGTQLCRSKRHSISFFFQSSASRGSRGPPPCFFPGILFQRFPLPIHQDRTPRRHSECHEPAQEHHLTRVFVVLDASVQPDREEPMHSDPQGKSDLCTEG